MNTPPPDLVQLQRWMLAAISQPSGIEEGTGIDAIIGRSRKQSSEQRLEIYWQAYFARLLGCLRELFPALSRLLGEELFDQFGIGYLLKYPPRSYTLGKLADRFVLYLSETKPTADGENAAAANDSYELLIDLAILEQAIDEVFDGPGEEEIPSPLAGQLAAVAQEEWPSQALIPSASLRLMPLRFPLYDLYTELRKGETEPALPAPKQSFVALWRRDYVVQRLPLTQQQYVLLSELARGQTIAEALELTAYATGLGADAPISEWFAKWTTLGLFAGLKP